MIPITDLSWQGHSWQSLLSRSIRTSSELATALDISIDAVDTNFPLNVPLPYLARIERGNPTDPLLLQVLATSHELDQSESGLTSPLQEEHFTRGFGLIQKYAGRVLVITTGSCAIHCRYCFRRHFPYAETQASTHDWMELLKNLAEDESISEVILSGGDPLMLKDRRLAWIADELGKIPHITTLRIHTRLPIVIPQRVTDDLTDWIRNSSLNIVFVTHVNHGNEIDVDVRAAMKLLRAANTTLLNQSVLLCGINDTVHDLEHLSRSLMEAGILPYYLHLMDPVLGAGHFNVDESIGIQLISELRQRVPGYLVPRLSREVPFETAKRIIA
ncbi:MAG: EF-P beta-lysylation protein EpmB [Candidatus Azotimanducaceae bacterium]|jgi:EF-P beta-lysylation protein EpmB